MLSDIAAVTDAARHAVETTVITDVHTHLFPPSHGDLLLWGADEVLTYHYLVAELFTVAPRSLTYETFWSLGKSAQADLVWEHVFLKHGALSEAARGAITTFNRLGLDVAGRDLAGIRKWFAAQDVDDYLAKVFELAGLDCAVMTNNPFLAEEAACLDRDLPCPDLLKTALRIDPLLVGWPEAVRVMARQGYAVQAEPDAKTFDETRRFLLDWSKKIDPVYFAASLGPEFAYPDAGLRTQVIDKAIMPAAMELGVPFAMMIGVRKQVNPHLGDGGDAVGVADVTAVSGLCQAYLAGKFLVTMLSRVNQHELAVLARKFGNLHLFGCWWFCNNPSIIEEMNRQRIELLGTAFTCQHSDARVLDQLIYKWPHTRAIMADVLADKYAALFTAGWRPTADEIARDVRALFGGSFAEFLAK
ncbi:MAG: glucuronate isomerase [Planctomycetota bacterium]|jgi:hypothetical protein